MTVERMSTAERTNPAALFSVAGKTALVTGAGRGIGKAIALGLAAAGAELILAGRAASVTATARQLAARGDECSTVDVDLADTATLERRMRDVAESREVDVLVNCAGVIHRGAELGGGDDEWRNVMSVNLEAPRMLSRTFAPGMLARGSGKIINIASLLSFQGGIDVASYAVSKHAVVGLTRAHANEWASGGVQVNAIAPGYIATDNTEPLRRDGDRAGQLLARIPAGRWGEPSDLVGATIFLASPASDYITGHTLVVDGGWMSR